MVVYGLLRQEFTPQEHLRCLRPYAVTGRARKIRTLSWRGRLVDDYAVNLPIVEDDGLKLPNCLTPSHPALQRIENIFKPISVGR